MTLKENEKEHILAAILESGSKKIAAQRVGISRRTIHNRLREWHLTKANIKQIRDEYLRVQNLRTTSAELQ